MMCDESSSLARKTCGCCEVFEVSVQPYSCCDQSRNPVRIFIELVIPARVRTGFGCCDLRTLAEQIGNIPSSLIHWAKRERHLEQMMTGTAGMYGGRASVRCVGCAETTSLTHLARGFPSQMIRLDCEGEGNRGYVRMVAGTVTRRAQISPPLIPVSARIA